ncbi:MAG: DUF1343 domain-containing protein [Elusimicrobiales bacterium]|nr:DUF1343 domain-containing protein [Elusimicrobiales bacterium]
MKLIIIFFLFSNTKLFCEILCGIDVLKKENFRLLNGKKVGIIVNHTSYDRNGKSDVDLLIDNSVDLKAIFSPEHGFYGIAKAGEIVEDLVYRGIPVYSLYGKNKRPTDEMLKDLDIILFDIQDVGARFYTYLTTMGYAMEEAAKRGIEFIVLDRPNPVSSEVIEGAVLPPNIKAFTAYFEVPTRHSLTAGEMAIFHKTKLKLELKLTIVKMEGYKKNYFFDDTGLKWINPSPNIRNLNAAILYSGIGCFEATNISVGRGTDVPFEFFGSPWLDSKKIIDGLKKSNLDGVDFYECIKKPTTDLYAGVDINGICVKVINKKKVRAFDIFVNATYLINKFHPNDFVMKEIEIAKMTGDSDFYNMIKSGVLPSDILKRYKVQHRKFKKYLKDNSIKLY